MTTQSYRRSSLRRAPSTPGGLDRRPSAGKALLAATMSAFVPGTGQLYAGRTGGRPQGTRAADLVRAQDADASGTSVNQRVIRHRASE